MHLIRLVGRPRILLMLVLASLSPLLAGPSAGQDSDAGNVLSVIKDNEFPSNAELAVRLSESTFDRQSRRVIIARDDGFADALSSGVLQHDAPLLLVPRTGPLPPRVIREIRRLAPAEAVVLGGSNAVAPDVEGQLAGLGLDTSRRAGASRVETAVQVASRDATDARTAILARAFPSNPLDPTQGFADALAAGAWAAANEWPVLLTETDSLTPTTRQYLESSRIERVFVVGGTAAISEAVFAALQQVVPNSERVAGLNRFGTALGIASKRQDQAGATPNAVILVNATSPNSFAGGFASAARSARLGAPIILADGVRLPASTREFLAEAGSDVGLTCVVHPLACGEGREAIGLRSYPLLAVDPPRNSRVAPGQLIQAGLGPAGEGARLPVELKGSCLSGPTSTVTDGDGRFAFRLAPDLSGASCRVEVAFDGAEDRLTIAYDYVVGGTGARRDGQVLLTTQVVPYGDLAPLQPVYVNVDTTCGSAPPRRGSVLTGVVGYPDFTSAIEQFTGPIVPIQGADSCMVQADVPPEARQVYWGLYAWSDQGLRNPLVLGQGPVATIDVADLGPEVTDLTLMWLVDLSTAFPSAPPALDGPAVVTNPDGAAIICDNVAIGLGTATVAAGSGCTARAPHADRTVATFIPGQAVQIGDIVQFTVPDDSRGATVVVLPGRAPQGSSGLSCSDPIELQIGVLDHDVLSADRPLVAYRLFGQADELLRIRMIDAGGQGELDPLVRIVGPDGRRLASNDDGGDGFDAYLEYTVTRTGPLCIEATGYAASAGDFLITVDTRAILRVQDVLSEAVPSMDHDVEAFGGERLVIEMRRPVGEQTDPVLHLISPTGSVLLSDDNGAGSANSRIEYEVPDGSNGLYVVRAAVRAERYGPYVLTASAD